MIEKTGTPGLADSSNHGVSTFSPRRLKRLMTYDDYKNATPSKFNPAESMVAGDSKDQPMNVKRGSVIFLA